MIRNLANSKYYLLMGIIVLLTGLFAVGCGTSAPERSGKMPNENTRKHVKGYQTGNSQAIKPVMQLPVLK